MTCTVLFFAGAADVAGCHQKELTFPVGSTVNDVFVALVLANEQFASMENSCAVAIDTTLCSFATAIYDGCTVAFLPPVSGG